MGDIHKTNVILLGTCRACDAVVRPGSDFCYNCGGRLEDLTVPTPETTAPIPAPVSELPTRPENGAIKNGPGANGGQQAAQRRRNRISKPRSNEPVQVVWKRDEGVGIAFIILSISAAVFAVVMIAIAYYLR